MNLESENQVLRQQAVTMTPNKLGRSRSIIQRGSESVNYGENKPTIDLRSASMKHREFVEVEDKPQKSLNEKQQENQDVLIRCISQHIGFAGRKPIAACTIYKCLLQWRSFEVERTTIFDRIIQTIGQAIESFRGIPQGASLSFINGGVSGVESLRQVEAKYPALLFKQQLTAYVEKIYGMIRDNLKKEISPLLGLCIQGGTSVHQNESIGEGQRESAAEEVAQEKNPSENI